MKHAVRFALVPATLLFGSLAIRPAEAQGPFWLDFESGVELTLQLNRQGARGDRRAQTNLFGEAEADLTITSSLGLGLVGVFRIDQRDRSTTMGNQAFQDQTGYVDQLYLIYTARPVALAAGKIHPRFGFARDSAPGLFGADFGERYEFAEQLGGGADVSLSDLFSLSPDWGANSIRAEVFQTDRSVLSSGVFSRRYEVEDFESGRRFFRNRFQRSFGGAGNTQDFSSVVVSLAGEGLTLPYGTLDYTTGFSQRHPGDDARGTGAFANEQGMVGGLSWSFRPTRSVKVTPMVEGVEFNNADGFRDQRRTVVTAGVAAEWRVFTASYVYGQQRDRGGNLEPSRATQHAIGLDVALDEVLPPQRMLPGLALQLGWRSLREDQVRSNDFGAALVWAYRF